MEINSGYAAKAITKADYAENGKSAKGDNFADLLSNIIDNSNSAATAPTSPALQTAPTAQVSQTAPTAQVAPTAQATPNEEIPADINTNIVSQVEGVSENFVENSDTPVVASKKPPINDDMQTNDGITDEIDAQQAMLSLILNQTQKPTEVTINSNANSTINADIVESAKNPVLAATSVQNSEIPPPELSGALSVKNGGKNQHSIGDKTNVTLNTAAEDNVAVDEVNVDTTATITKKTNQDTNNLSNILAKNNFVVHGQAQNHDNSSKAQDLASLNANLLSSTDNVTQTTNSVTTGDINTNSADQTSSIRLNLDNIQSLAAIMVRKHYGGEKSFTIRLDPPELGEIKVELKIDKDKKAKAVISASNHEALGDLTKSVKDLTQSLKDGGIDINEEDFEFNLYNQSEDNEFAKNSRSQSDKTSAEKITSEDSPPEITNPIVRGNSKTQVWHNVRVSLIA